MTGLRRRLGSQQLGLAHQGRQLGPRQLGHPQLSRRAREGHPAEPSPLVWLRLRDATPRARRELDRIVEASIALADEEGPTWLSMRHLATALATGTTSLYRYVKGKDELLELMVDAVNGESPGSRRGDPVRPDRRLAGRPGPDRPRTAPAVPAPSLAGEPGRPAGWPSARIRSAPPSSPAPSWPSCRPTRRSPPRS